MLVLLLQVECKKAQPKEVMLPANLAKTRAAGRGTYGELLMLNPGPVTSGSATSAFRYTPYPIPASANLPVATAGHSIPVTAIAVAPAPVHYAPTVYDVTGCKRVLAAPAAFRPISARAAPTLTYSMSDLLGVQSLEIPTVFASALPAPGFPAAAYAAYAAGRGYSGYPSFGLPYPTVDLTNGQLTPNNNTPLLTQALSGNCEYCLSYTLLPLTDTNYTYHLMNNYQAAAAAAQGFGPPASPHTAANTRGGFPTSANSPGPTIDMYSSNAGDNVGYVQATSPQPSGFPAIAVSRAPLNYSPGILNGIHYPHILLLRTNEAMGKILIFDTLPWSSRPSYGDDAISCVQLKREGKICTVKCKICPEHKVHAKLYGVTLTVDEDKVTSVQCHDFVAAQGGCKHSIALLMWIHRRSEEPSCTEVQCYWLKSKLFRVGTTLKFITAKDLSNGSCILPSNPSVLETVLEEGKKRKLSNCELLRSQRDCICNDFLSASMH
ncbi:hypothetical protein FQA39_LY09433 [Lamprigera yunnana]|nr:hypothetical protein FQA39_LY09433 [Lamprigera yunnana]